MSENLTSVNAYVNARAQELLLSEIGQEKTTRRDVARWYAFAITTDSDHSAKWAAPNGAIMEKWSVSGLNYIKALAWKMIAAQDAEQCFYSRVREMETF